MSIFALSGLINATVSLLLSITSIRKSRQQFIYFIFSAFNLVIFVWSLSYFAWLISTDAFIATTAIIILSLAANFIPPLYLHWIISVLDLNKQKISQVRLGYIIALFISLITPTRLFFSHLTSISDFLYWPQAGPLYLIYIAFYLTFSLYGAFLLLNEQKKVTGIRKNQLRYIIFASTIGFGCGFFNFPLWYGIEIKPYANLGVSFYVAVLAYAIINYHLMDIRLVARKSFVYLAHIATVIGLFFIAKSTASFFISTRFEDLIDLILLIIAALFASPIRKKYFRIANKYFFSSLYDPQQVIAETSEKLRSTIELSEIFGILNTILKKSLHLKTFGVLFYSQGTHAYTPVFNDGFELGRKKGFPSNNFLHQTYTLKNLPIILADLEHEPRIEYVETVKMLRTIGVEILMPLNTKGQVIGLLVFSKKESGDLYNDEDLKVLTVISSQASVAFDNAKLYQEVANFNNTLQTKVDQQTADITAKAEHLEKLMHMRSEFLDITSHQLRTPVSVIKGVLSMIKEGSVPADKLPIFINNAYEKSIKLGEIINDILRASEMDSDKFELHLKPVELLPILEKIKNDKQPAAEQKQLLLVFNLPKALPLISSDERYIEHAIINLINNSLQYTQKGSITVSAEEVKKYVIIRVADTGIGIPIKDRKKLFHKFARAENAVNTYTDGSGLGLFIIKHVVDATPGAKIEIEKSEEGKGTSFALWLPITK